MKINPLMEHDLETTLVYCVHHIYFKGSCVASVALRKNFTGKLVKHAVIQLKPDLAAELAKHSRQLKQ